MKKILKIFLIILILIIAVLFGARLYFRLPVSDYYKNSEKAFKIPGLSEGFVPQGLAYSEEKGVFLITGYMKDGSACPIYVINADGTYNKGVYLKDKDGNPVHPHAGGIEIWKDYVYVADSNNLCLNVFNYSDIEKANEKDFVIKVGDFSTKSENDEVSVACMTVHDNQLIVAEFYRAENYETKLSHRFKTTAGDDNTAIAAVYELSEDEEYGINRKPIGAISLPGLVQGITYHDNKIYISTSYSTAFSHIYSYDEEKSKRDKTMTLLDTEVPLMELDSSSLINDMKIAPMSEEIVFYNNEMYTMCESASMKYIFGNLTGARYCYKTR